jgi:hypothetical protein
LFDTLYTKATVVLQSGSPGFEYKRSDLNPKIKFIGALYPIASQARKKDTGTMKGYCSIRKLFW